MNLDKDKIVSIEAAKEFYKELGCSHFHMGREYPHRYDEYIKLNISEKQEKKWNEESLNDYLQKIYSQDSDKNKLWSYHSYISELLQSIKTVDSVLNVYKATVYISSILSSRDKLLVAETILGRSPISGKRGLIFLANRLKMVDISKEFASIALDLSLSAKKRIKDKNRCESAIKKCEQIKKLLGFT